MTVYKHELKACRKSFLIWLACVCGMCFGCVLLYASVEGSLEDMGDLFSNMGAMSAAFGMDRISINTMTGYYATEVVMIHSLGGAMFAAMLGGQMLSKEEGGHTAEFLMTLPITRIQVVKQKGMALLTCLFAFQVISTGFYLLGFVLMEEDIPWEPMMALAGAQLLLFVEVAGIAFLMSAFSRRTMAGPGLGMVLVFFSLDLMCRLIPVLEDVRYVVPFYYVNGADIFTKTEIPLSCFGVAVLVTAGAFAGAGAKYAAKDLGA